MVQSEHNSESYLGVNWDLLISLSGRPVQRPIANRRHTISAYENAVDNGHKTIFLTIKRCSFSQVIMQDVICGNVNVD